MSDGAYKTRCVRRRRRPGERGPRSALAGPTATSWPGIAPSRRPGTPPPAAGRACRPPRRGGTGSRRDRDAAVERDRGLVSGRPGAGGDAAVVGAEGVGQARAGLLDRLLAGGARAGQLGVELGLAEGGQVGVGARVRADLPAGGGEGAEVVPRHALQLAPRRGVGPSATSPTRSSARPPPRMRSARRRSPAPRGGRAPAAPARSPTGRRRRR